jgi:protein TonB
VEPVYPPEARKAGIEGTVVLEAMIGTDGRIHDLRVISAPAASLAASSFAAVSQWEYRPYLLMGRVVPVETTVTVTFSLGQ